MVTVLSFSIIIHFASKLSNDKIITLGLFILRMYQEIYKHWNVVIKSHSIQVLGYPNPWTWGDFHLHG
jgi:hypothetical protein